MTEQYTKIIVKNLKLDMRIGIYDFEKSDDQQVIVNIELWVTNAAAGESDNHDDAVCYEATVRAVQKIAAAGHINLLESFVEEIADACLENTQVEKALVRAEKPDIMPECGAVGVEILRSNT